MSSFLYYKTENSKINYKWENKIKLLPIFFFSLSSASSSPFPPLSFFHFSTSSSLAPHSVCGSRLGFISAGVPEWLYFILFVRYPTVSSAFSLLPNLRASVCPWLQPHSWYHTLLPSSLLLYFVSHSHSSHSPASPLSVMLKVEIYYTADITECQYEYVWSHFPSYFHIMVTSFNAETEHFTSVYESMWKYSCVWVTLIRERAFGCRKFWKGPWKDGSLFVF